jgi:hypothetical protein
MRVVSEAESFNSGTRVRTYDQAQKRFATWDPSLSRSLSTDANRLYPMVPMLKILPYLRR